MSAHTRLCHHPGKMINNQFDHLDHLDHLRETKDLLGTTPPLSRQTPKKTQKYQILQMVQQAAPGQDSVT
jgi:hypothetical protein